MDQQPHVIVRTSVRHDLCLRGLVKFVPEGAGGVRLSTAAGAKDGWVDVDVVDLASGGLGFISTVFFPRRSLMKLRVMGPGEGSPVVLEAAVRVQRVHMTDRRPAYLLGCSFDSLSDAERGQLDSLFAALSGGARD